MRPNKKDYPEYFEKYVNLIEEGDVISALKTNHQSVLDFIEDFINHRVWGLSDEFAEYIVNIDNDKIAFFQSRGAIEPYILLDKQFTEDTYKNSNIEVITIPLELRLENTLSPVDAEYIAPLGVI